MLIGIFIAIFVAEKHPLNPLTTLFNISVMQRFSLVSLGYLWFKSGNESGWRSSKT